MSRHLTWPVIGAAVVAIVTVAGAIVVLTSESPETKSPTAPYASATTTPESTPLPPEVTWRRSAEDVFGRKFAQFRDPLVGNVFPTPAPTFIDAGDVYLAYVGLPDPSTGTFDEPTMVGLDAADGSTLWRSPTGALDACAAHPLDNAVVCYSNGESAGTEVDDASIVEFDVRSGARSSTRVHWPIVGIGTDNDALYTISSTSTPDGYQGGELLSRGTAGNPTSDYSLVFPLTSGFVSGLGPSITVDGTSGLVRSGSEAAGFDTVTGAVRWTRQYSDECVFQPYQTSPSLVVMTRKTCTSSEPFLGYEAVAPDGRVVATSPAINWPYPEIDAPTNTSFPIVVGDTAFDRVTGERRWSSPILTGTNGTAVVGDVVIVRAPGTAHVSALDLRTGALRWESDPGDFYPITAFAAGLAYSTAGGTVETTDITNGAVPRRVTIEPAPERYTSPSLLSRVTALDGHLVYSSTSTLAVVTL